MDSDLIVQIIQSSANICGVKLTFVSILQLSIKLANVALQMRQCRQIDSNHGSGFETRIPSGFPPIVGDPLSGHRWVY